MSSEFRVRKVSLQLNNLNKTRRTLSRIIRQFDDMEEVRAVDAEVRQNYRLKMDMLKLLIGTLKMEADLVIEQRISKLERQLSGRE